MSEDKSDPTTPAPGSGAGDSAPTQAIPRIPKADEETVTSAKKTPAKKAPAKKVTPAKSSSAGTSSSTQTDKGRPRDVKPAGGPKGRPLTASDYARTTKPSPATTAVIPAVKDEPKDKQKPKAPAPKASSEPAESGRRASLRLTHIEPWSVTRLAFTISVALMIVALVAVTIFWVVLDVTGVWDQINGSVTSVLSDDSSSFNITDYLGFGRLVGLTLVVSAINVVLMTVLATIAAYLYNLAAQLLGGVEVTFAEEK